MPAPALYTFSDAVEHLTHYAAGGGRAATDYRIRQAALLAYHDVVEGHQWFNKRKHGRIALSAPVSTGTITYTSSSRALVHSATAWATLASWAAYGRVRIGDVVAAIDSVSGTTATLNSTLTFPADIAAGTSYQLYRNIYTLPSDFQRIDRVIAEDDSELTRIDYGEWMRRERVGLDSNDTPRFYAVGPDPDLYGSLALYVWPQPSQAETLDFYYEAKARPIAITGWDAQDYAGTISISSAAVTGTSTAFRAEMVGAIMRLRNDSTVPEGLASANRYHEQRVISAYGSATGVTLDSSPSLTYSGTKYRVTDPVDIVSEAWPAFLRNCEWQLDVMVGDNAKAQLSRQRWTYAQRLAMEADWRYKTPMEYWSPYDWRPTSIQPES